MTPDREGRTPADFCRSLPWDIDIDWTDRVGIHQIDDDRRAKFDFSTYGYGGHYVGFYVSIVSKTSGPVDKAWMPFAGLVAGWKVVGCEPGPVVIDHCGWRWYGRQEQVDARPYCEAVENYIGEWR